MALSIYVEVTELSPPFLEHGETREKHHIRSLMQGQFMYFSWKAIVFAVHMNQRNQSLLQKQDICFYSMLWSYGTSLMHNQSSTATSQQLQVT